MPCQGNCSLVKSYALLKSETWIRYIPQASHVRKIASLQTDAKPNKEKCSKSARKGCQKHCCLLTVPAGIVRHRQRASAFLEVRRKKISHRVVKGQYRLCNCTASRKCTVNLYEKFSIAQAKVFNASEAAQWERTRQHRFKEELHGACYSRKSPLAIIPLELHKRKKLHSRYSRRSCEEYFLLAWSSKIPLKLQRRKLLSLPSHLLLF